MSEEIIGVFYLAAFFALRKKGANFAPFPIFQLDQAIVQSNTMAPMISALISAVGAIIFLSSSSTSFTALPKLTRHNVCHHTAQESFTSLPLASADEENSNPTKKETFKSSNPLELAAWYGVEAFGKVFRQEKNNNVDANSGSVDLTNSPSSF